MKMTPEFREMLCEAVRNEWEEGMHDFAVNRFTAIANVMNGADIPGDGEWMAGPFQTDFDSPLMETVVYFYGSEFAAEMAMRARIAEEGPSITPGIYKDSITVGEHYALRDAIDAAHKNGTVTWIRKHDGGKIAAIVPPGRVAPEK